MELVPSGEFGASDLAITHMLSAYYNWADSRENSMQTMQSMQSMLYFARLAVVADDHDAWAHTTPGLANLFFFKWDKAPSSLDHAISLYPNFAPAFGVKGMVLACMSETESALGNLDKARRLSPHDSLIPLWLLAIFWAYWTAEGYEAALACVQEFVRLAPENPTARRQLAAALWMTGQHDKARDALAQYVAITPTHTADDIRGRVPSRDPSYVDRFIETLREVGWNG